MKKLCLILLPLFINISAFAQIPQLVKNINPNTTPDQYSHSNAQKGILYNSQLYFAAESNQGVELWKTNGSTAGTLLTRDLFSFYAGNSSFPREFTAYGGNVYFFIGDTAANTTEESKIFKMDVSGYISYAAGGLFNPKGMVLINNSFFFTGRVNSSSNGVELLEFTGGNVIEHDIFPGADSSNPKYLTVKNDSLFFSAIGSVAAGRELWVYANGNLTQMNIKPGAGSSNPSYLTVYNNELFFSADNGTNGAELMKANVPGLSATLVKDINAGAAGSNPKNITLFNSNLYFSADDGTNGVELWKSGGTTAGTILLNNINPFGNSNPGEGSGFVAVGSKLYFAADDGTDDIELWETDGTQVNTGLSADINPSGSSNPTSLIALNSNLIFAADDGTNGDELWKYDGSNATLIQNIQPVGYTDKPYTINRFNNKVYFVADNGTIGKELWSTDGSTAALVKDINIGTRGNSNPYLMDTMGGFAYLGAYENNGYLSLIKTNGITAGTTTVKPGDDAATGFQAFPYNRGKALGSNFIFTAIDNVNGGELWKTNGTNAGTVLIKDIRVGNSGSNPQSFTKVGSLVFFTAETDAAGRELWKTDGTAAGTVLIKDINPGINPPDIDNMVAMNGKIYFIANDGTNGSELWTSDGTAVGTIMVKNINPGAADALARGIQNLKAISNVLYFAANNGVNGTELWKSDGTNGGTVLVKDINPGINSSNPQWFTELNGQIYFDADNDNTGGRLFRTNGTTAGTNLFFNIQSTFLHARVGNKVLFFCYPNAINSQNGFELWGTDGTTTFQVKDFVPGIEGVGYMFIDNFPVYQGRWYFNLDNDGINGLEAWSSDGTTAGTVLHEVNPGVASSFSTNFLGVNPMLFSSDDGTNTGRELYSLSLTVLPITGLEFNVQKQNTVAVLNFKTKTEINNKGFVIEHSLTGQQYDSIGFVTPKGINGNGATYTFTDVKPADGKNYYRLKQIDFDGRINYSPVRFVDFSKDFYVKTYPNPTTDVLNISTGYSFKNASLKIYSGNAQLVKQQVVNSSGTISINIKDLPAGFYNVTIKDELHTVQLFFIKQ